MRRHPQATTAAKVGIVACATASSGTVTNTIDAVAWQQSCTDIDDDDGNVDDARLLVLLGQQWHGTVIVGGIKSP